MVTTAGPTTAAATSAAGRRKRSVDEDVTILLNTQIPFEAKNSVAFLDNLSLKVRSEIYINLENLKKL